MTAEILSTFVILTGGGLQKYNDILLMLTKINHCGLYPRSE